MSRDSYISSSDYNLPNIPARGPGPNDPNQNAASTTLPLPGAPISTNPSGFVDREISWKALPDGTDIGDGEGITNLKDFRLQIDEPTYTPGQKQEDITSLREFFFPYIPNHSVDLPTPPNQGELSLDDFRKAVTFAVYIEKIKPESKSKRVKRNRKCWWMKCKSFLKVFWGSNKCWRYLYKHDGAITFRIIGGYGGFNSPSGVLQDPVFDWSYGNCNVRSTDNTIMNGTPLTLPYAGSVAVDPALGYAEVTIDCLVGIKDKAAAGTGTLTVKCRTTGHTVTIQCGVPYDSSIDNPRGFIVQPLVGKTFSPYKNRAYVLGSDSSSAPGVSAVKGENQFWTWPVMPMRAGPPQAHLIGGQITQLFGDDEETAAVETDAPISQDGQSALLIDGLSVVMPNTENINVQYFYRPWVCDPTTGVWAQSTGAWSNLGPAKVASSDPLTKVIKAQQKITMLPAPQGGCMPRYIDVKCDYSNSSGSLSLSADPSFVFEGPQPLYLLAPNLTGPSEFFRVDTSKWNATDRKLTFKLNRLIAVDNTQIEFGYFTPATPMTTAEIDEYFISQSIMAREPVYGTATSLSAIPISVLATATNTGPTFDSSMYINTTDEDGNSHNDIVLKSNSTTLNKLDQVYSVSWVATTAQYNSIRSTTKTFLFRLKYTNKCMDSIVGFFPAAEEYSPLQEEYDSPEVIRTALYPAGTTVLNLVSIPTGPPAMRVGDFIYGLDGAIPLYTRITNIDTATRQITLDKGLTVDVPVDFDPTVVTAGSAADEERFFRHITL